MTIMLDTRDGAPNPESDDSVGRPELQATRVFRLTAWILGVMVIGLGALALVSGRAELPSEERILVRDSAGSVSLLDPAEPDPVYTVDNAVASSDRSTLYQLVELDRQSRLNQIDPESGETIATRVVPEPGLEIRIVSPDGDALALMERREEEGGLYVPESRTQTSITVVRSDAAEPRTYDLAGNFEPEAFTRDGAVLYLLEFWPAESPDRYFVRNLDLGTGEISDTFSPEVDLNPEMRGHARAQVVHPDGDFLYTLYTLDEVGTPVIDPATGENPDRWAFVHVISLDEDWSYCIFLPVPMGRSEATTGLAITPDGGTLYAIDAGVDRIVAIDTTSFEVTTTAQLQGWEMTSRERVPAAAGPDGALYVALGSLVVRYDEELLPAAVYRPGEAVQSVDVAPDGRSLRLALPAGVVKVIDIESGVETATLRIPSSDREIQFVGPPLNPNSITERLQKGQGVPCAC